MTLPPLTPVDAPKDSTPNPNYDGKQKVARRAPVRKSGEKPVKVATPVEMPAKGVLKKALVEVYAMAGLGVRMWSEGVSDAILTNADKCAESLEVLAETNESVRKLLLSLTKTSAWGVVIAAHAPIAMAVYVEMNTRKTRREETREDPTIMTDEEREATL